MLAPGTAVQTKLSACSDAVAPGRRTARPRIPRARRARTARQKPVQPRSPAEAAKGRPTPKRSEAERKRRQPITGSRARSGAAPRTPEDKARARDRPGAQVRGDEAGRGVGAQPARPRPGQALARDYVDSKRRVSEYYMYVLVVLLAAVFLRNKADAAVSSRRWSWCWSWSSRHRRPLIRRSLRKLVAERLPGESTRGLTMYAVMRALQIRRFRMPAPRVGRADKILRDRRSWNTDTSARAA